MTLFTEKDTAMTSPNTALEFVNHVGMLSESLNKEGAPGWLKAMRRQGLSRLKELPWPSVRDEEWKYTDISPLTASVYALSTSAQLREKEAFLDYGNGDDINIVFVNGFFSKDLSNMQAVPSGVVAMPLQDMEETSAASFQELFSKENLKGEDAFIALNEALVRHGIYIAMDENVILRQLIHIVHITSTTGEMILTAPRTFLRLGRSSEVTILESHVSFLDDNLYFADALTDIFLGENAVLHYCKAQKESLKAYHIGITRVRQDRNSVFDGFSLAAGGALTRHDLHVTVNGEGANARLNGFYSVSGSQHVDNHTCVDHCVPQGTSNQLYKGILQGSGRAVFNGKILVRPIAQKTNSYQLNKNLLLGKDCRVDTKPQLEIFADDVKCTHGATIGQLNEDEIFYLQTRCIPRKTAVKLLVRGFADDLLNTVHNPSVYQKLNKLLEPAFEVLECTG